MCPTPHRAPSLPHTVMLPAWKLLMRKLPASLLPHPQQSHLHTRLLKELEPCGEMSAPHGGDKAILWTGALALRLVPIFFFPTLDPGFSWEWVLETLGMRWTGCGCRENSTSATPAVWEPDTVFFVSTAHTLAHSGLPGFQSFL